MNSKLETVSEDSFDVDVLQAETPVLVDFWADWCGPCKTIAPILEEIASHYAGKLKVLKLNVDENNTIAAKYGVRGIPTLILYKGGKVVASKVGTLSKSQLSVFLDSHV